MDDWLDEVENFSSRRERMPADALAWVKQAWELGSRADEIERLQQLVRTLTKADPRHDLAARVEQLQADKAAISQTASDYLHEIERLRAALDEIAKLSWAMSGKGITIARCALEGEKGKAIWLSEAASCF